MPLSIWLTLSSYPPVSVKHVVNIFHLMQSFFYNYSQNPYSHFISTSKIIS